MNEASNAIICTIQVGLHIYVIAVFRSTQTAGSVTCTRYISVKAAAIGRINTAGFCIRFAVQIIVRHQYILAAAMDAVSIDISGIHPKVLNGRAVLGIDQLPYIGSSLAFQLHFTGQTGIVNRAAACEKTAVMHFAATARGYGCNTQVHIAFHCGMCSTVISAGKACKIQKTPPIGRHIHRNSAGNSDTSKGGVLCPSKRTDIAILGQSIQGQIHIHIQRQIEYFRICDITKQSVFCFIFLCIHGVADGVTIAVQGTAEGFHPPASAPPFVKVRTNRALQLSQIQVSH